MIKLLKIKIIPIVCIVGIIMFFINFTGKIHAQVQPIKDVEEKLENISDEEKSILKDLFALMQEIEMLEKEEEEITREIEAVQAEIDSLEKMIESRQKEYDKQLEVLKQFLESYQKKGPASYLDIILSDDLTEVLRSLDILKDLSRNTGELLKYLEEEKEQLKEQREILDKKKRLLEDKKQELQKSIDKKMRLKNELEEYLDTLKDKKEYYDGQLDYLKNMWDELKDLFSDIVSEFTRIVEEEGFPIEDLNMEINFSGVKGIIYEKTFNNILKENSELPETVFTIQANKVIIEVPEKHLILEGNFMIENESTIRFIVNKGSFYNMPLENAAFKELFSNGSLLIDFRNFMDDIKLKSVIPKNGYMEFDVALDLKSILEMIFK